MAIFIHSFALRVAFDQPQAGRRVFLVVPQCLHRPATRVALFFLPAERPSSSLFSERAGEQSSFIYVRERMKLVLHDEWRRLSGRERIMGCLLVEAMLQTM